jgi:hypothetical protein
VGHQRSCLSSCSVAMMMCTGGGGRAAPPPRTRAAAALGGGNPPARQPPPANPMQLVQFSRLESRDALPNAVKQKSNTFVSKTRSHAAMPNAAVIYDSSL